MIVFILSVFQCIQSFRYALIMAAFSDLHCCVEEENYNADSVDWHDHLEFPRTVKFQIICSLIISKVDQPSNQEYDLSSVIVDPPP